MKEESPRRTLPPYDLLYGSIDLLKELAETGTRLIIPRAFLHGRQRKDEYDNGKRKQVEAALRKEGIVFLTKHPIIICAIPEGNQLMLVIIDGHHRARFSGLYNITEIPCLISTPTDVVQVLNRQNVMKIDEVSFIRNVKEEIAAALQTFYRNQPGYIPSRSINGISNIDQLKERYRSF